MALARARRNESGFNYWPGFVDALSTLVLSIVFLLSVFLVVQFFLSQEVTGKDKALEQLNARIAELNDLLSLEKLGKFNLNDQLTQVRAGLASAETERDRVKGLYEGLAGAGNCAASSRRLRKRCKLRKNATGNPRDGSPISASGSTSRWRSGCRNCRATVPNSSGGCAPFSATGRTSASSATALSFSRKYSLTPDRPCYCPRAAPSWKNWRPRWLIWTSRFRAKSPGCCGSTDIPTCGRL